MVIDTKIVFIIIQTYDTILVRINIICMIIIIFTCTFVL